MKDVFIGVLFPAVWILKTYNETCQVRIKHKNYELINQYEMYKTKRFRTKYEKVALEK